MTAFNLTAIQTNWHRGARSPLARRFAMATVLCSSVMAVLITTTQLYLTYLAQISALEQHLEDIERSQVPSLIESAWNIDEKLIETQLQGMLQLEGVHYVALKNDTLSFAFGDENNLTDRAVYDFPLTRHEGERLYDLGVFTVVVSRDHIFQTLLNQVLFVLLANSVKTLLVATFILIIYQITIGQYLSAIAEFVWKLNTDNKTTTLALNRRSKGNDELDALEAAINQWHGSQQKLSQQQLTNNLALAKKRDELTALNTQLTQANEELEEFAYRTSHDLSSPLISTIKLLSIIEHQLHEKKIENSIEYLDVAQQSLIKLKILVSDILTLSKLNHTQKQPTLFSLTETVNDCLIKFGYMEGFERIHFTVNDDCDKTILLDKENVTLILENLISNAIKYHDRHNPTPAIDITIKKINKTIELSVADNGIGIPEKSTEQLFEMFKRFHPKTAFGSGLGLYMVKKSVDKLNGSIQYQRMTPGTKFTVKLPVTE